MRETLSKRPGTTVKMTSKTKVASNRAQAKFRSAPKAKSHSATKPQSRSVKIDKKATTKKLGTKSTAKVTKPVAKKLAAKSTAKTVKPVAKPDIKAVKKTAKKTAASQKTSKRTAAARTKVKDTKVKAKAPVKPLVTAKTAGKRLSKTVVKVQTVRISAKRRTKVILPIRVAPPPPPEPPRRTVTSGALRAFEHAVKSFNRRHFEEAKPMFESLLTKFPNEVEIVARAQMYIQVCGQKLAQAVSAPRNADELYDRGVFALNIGDFSQAKNFFEKALRLKPDEPHLLYSLAATHAQTGSLDQALDYLRRTIQLQPRYRTQALNDSDFSGLRENKQFLELLGLASPFDMLQSRR